LQKEVIACQRCPRLVAWRAQVAREKRAAYRNETYWGKPVAGFGDPAARLLIVGLAPGAHGANRTGRVFTGDRSGDWLYGALHRAGFANQPSSRNRADGLKLIGCYITSCVRCCPPDNRPTTEERDTCQPFLVRELSLLGGVRVIVCLGGFAWDGLFRALGTFGELPRPLPRFGHGAEAAVLGFHVLGCYHPSQQNTFTGRLTRDMLDVILVRARELGELP
jgi:uracil-DNA glycosylase family 4